MDPECEINDAREQKVFSSMTFSEFKKSDVKKEFLKSLRETSLEPACYWCAELICSGHYVDIWETIILFYSRYIQQGRVNLSLYLEHRVNNFRDIVKGGYIGDELSMRNNDKIRKLFAEIICVLCDAPTRHPYEEVKIDNSYFITTNITSKLKAPDVSYVGQNFKNDDPKELYIAINELCYNISNEGKNVMLACFWTEWIMTYQKMCFRKKTPCKCEKRHIVEVDEKYQQRVDWIIWKTYLSESEKRMDKRVNKIIRSLLNLYSLRFSSGVFQKRRYLMYLAISLLVDNVSINGEMVSKETKIQIANVHDKLHSIYKQIKLKEQSSSTNYLFANTKQSNLEKTMGKLDKLNEFGDTFIPRL